MMETAATISKRLSHPNIWWRAIPSNMLNVADWESGKNDMQRMPGPNPKASQKALMFDAMLACVSITPLGTPVVPEV